MYSGGRGVLLNAIFSGQDRNRKASRLCGAGVGGVLRAGGLGASPVGFASATRTAGVLERLDPGDPACPSDCDRRSGLRVSVLAETPDRPEQDGLWALDRLGEPVASRRAGRVGFLVVDQVTSLGCGVFPLAARRSGLPRRPTCPAGMKIKSAPPTAS